VSPPRNVLLLIGSPRFEKSNSYVIGKFLLDKLKERGLSTEVAFINRLVLNREGTERLLKVVDNSDIIVLAAPLYIDSLPSLTVKAMELINEHRKVVSPDKSQLLSAIVNNGFPEKEQMDIAFKNIRNFAQESNFRWGGEIRVGWGVALNCEPLNEKKGMTRKLTKGLLLASDNLSNGQMISKKAEDLVSTLFLPLFLVKILKMNLNRSWDKQAKENNVKTKILDTPYELI